MKTVYYITRTIPGGGTGGSLIRQGTVRFLREAGYKVVVVALSDRTSVNKDNIFVKGVTSRFSTRFHLMLYDIGIYDDYLQTWASSVCRILSARVKTEDVVLATSGGELGTLMVARQLKEMTGCRAVYNLHDPIDYTTIDGEFSFIGNVKMRARDKAESKLFRSADAIVTSSQFYADALKRKYPELKDVFTCHHFGYIEKFEFGKNVAWKSERVNVVYGGNMGPLQGPEILIKTADYFPDVDFTFVGNLVYQGDVPANVTMKQNMSYKDYISYLSQKADIGFLSLVGNVSKLCVPSKLYEYINVGIPILAVIDGDARQIVNDNGFGIATDYSVKSLKNALKDMLQPGYLDKTREAVAQKRDGWSMQHTIQELIQIL